MVAGVGVATAGGMHGVTAAGSADVAFRSRIAWMNPLVTGSDSSCAYTGAAACSNAATFSAVVTTTVPPSAQYPVAAVGDSITAPMAQSLVASAALPENSLLRLGEAREPF